MCLPKEDGGIRCPSEANRQLRVAQERLASEPDNPDAMAAAQEAEHQLALTATARGDLAAKCADPSLDPLEAIEARRLLDALNAEHADLTKANPFTMKYDTAEEQIAAYQKEIEDAYGNLANVEGFTELLSTMSRFHNYSPTNQLLIYLQAPNATKVAGFRKWQSDFDRTVKKGERAIRIFAPSTVRIPVKDKAGKPVLDEKGKPVTEVKRGSRFVGVAVFADYQTEGKPLPMGYTLNESPPEGFEDDLRSAIEREGFTVRSDDTGFKGGWSDGSAREVVINSSLSPAQRARTLAHELGHIKAGHLNRLDEYHSGADGCRGEMEMEAESIAYVLCRSNGMSTALSDRSADYISGWEKHTDGKTVKDSVKTVSATLRELLSSGSWRNIIA